MSLYRLVRASALLALLNKHRVRLYRVCGALAVAGVTDWLYGDIADYLRSTNPDLQAWVLAAKTIVVYSALAYILWQFRPAMRRGAGKSDATRDIPASAGEESGPPDELMHKPKLQSRKDSILKRPKNG